jgi:SAM-dependent methyltransferase
MEERWAEVERIADLRPTDRVLDVGCADGLIALEAARLVEHVHGFDRSAKWISAAASEAVERGVTNVSFEVASLADYRPEPLSYDVVLFLAVWGKPLDRRAGKGKDLSGADAVGPEQLTRLLDAARRQLIMRVGVQASAGKEARLPLILEACEQQGFDALCYSRPLHEGRTLRGNMIVANRRGTDARVGQLPALALIPISMLADHPVVKSAAVPV